MRASVVFLLLALTAVQALPQTVVEEKGNIVHIDGSGSRKLLTASGLDSNPSLSPDNRQVVFVRRTPGHTIDTGLGEVDDNELWILPVDRRAKERRVLVGRPGGFDPKGALVLAGFAEPQFSPDGKSVYFQATTWATASAIHRLNLSTGKTRFVFAGVGMEIVASGKYVGFLIAAKDPLTPDRGRIVEYWLLDPNGKEVKRIGETDDELKRFKDSQK